ncbi:MAG: PAS domain S-box protein [Verrucomicrobiota bacterium]
MSSPNQALASTAPSATPVTTRRRQGAAQGRNIAIHAPATSDDLAPGDLHQKLQKLQDRQDELELQNAELRRTLVAVEAARARYFDLYDLAPVAYVTISAAGRILEINLSAATLLGMARGEIIQQTLTRFILDDDETIYALLREQIFATGEQQTCELRLVSQDAAPFWVRLDATFTLDGSGTPQCRVLLRDISERKQAEQTLRDLNTSLEHRILTRTLKLNQSEGRFRMLAEASFEGIAVSEGGILLDGNSQLAACLGYELVEMTGRPVMDFIAPESRALVAERIGTGEGTTDECIGLRRDGSTFPIAIHTRMGTWQGRLTQITVLQDLSEAKQTAAMLHAQQAKLEHVQRFALVNEVSAGIIHQLGQPLSAMGSNIAVAMTRLKTCRAKCCGSLPIIQDIAADSVRMREIVVHLRKLAKPGLESTRAGIDLNAIVTGALPLLRLKAENCRCRMAIELGQHLPPVYADAVQMSQVIYNMVHNALEACADCAQERRVVVITTRVLDGEGVEVCVRDAGVGIAPENLNRLFIPFFSTKPDGLGVGLRLSRTIVEAHGGRIEGYNNAAGVGATFRVVLPAHRDPSQTQPVKKRNLP